MIFYYRKSKNSSDKSKNNSIINTNKTNNQNGKLNYNKFYKYFLFTDSNMETQKKIEDRTPLNRKKDGAGKKLRNDRTNEQCDGPKGEGGKE